MSVLRSNFVISLFMACFILGGCSSDSPPPAKVPEPVASVSTVVTAEPPKPPEPKEPSNVQVDNRITEACGNLPITKFDFDSDNISAEAESAVRSIADCFINGPLKGKSMKLVGHADPRGETLYNLALGQKRAASVGAFLQQKGVLTQQISTMSKGEFEATGTEEEGWAKDRRVQVFLAD